MLLRTPLHHRFLLIVAVLFFGSSLPQGLKADCGGIGLYDFDGCDFDDGESLGKPRRACNAYASHGELSRSSEDNTFFALTFERHRSFIGRKGYTLKLTVQIEVAGKVKTFGLTHQLPERRWYSHDEVTWRIFRDQLVEQKILPNRNSPVFLIEI